MLDNADNKADFFPKENSAANGLAQFIPRGGQGTVVVATRDLGLAVQLAGLGSNILFKGMMEVARAEQLLIRHYPEVIRQERESII